jgi:hypothetical protein
MFCEGERALVEAFVMTCLLHDITTSYPERITLTTSFPFSRDLNLKFECAVLLILAVCVFVAVLSFVLDGKMVNFGDNGHPALKQKG